MVSRWPLLQQFAASLGGQAPSRFPPCEGMHEVPIDFREQRSRDKSAIRREMVTICSGFLDLCIPLNAFDKTQPKQADEPKHAMKSQHDFYWEERCDKSPTAPGCKIYDD